MLKLRPIPLRCIPRYTVEQIMAGWGLWEGETTKRIKNILVASIGVDSVIDGLTLTIEEKFD